MESPEAVFAAFGKYTFRRALLSTAIFRIWKIFRAAHSFERFAETGRIFSAIFLFFS